MKPRMLSTALLLALLLPLAAGAARNARAENTALLIGVGKYRIEGANLPGIDKDLQKMRQVAKALGYTRIEEIRDNNATAASVEQQIKRTLHNTVGPQDSVLLYFSGHGSQVPDTSGDEGSDKADEVLLCHDVTVDTDARKMTGGYLLDDKVGELIAGINAKQIFVLIDACHSGTATKALSAANEQKGLQIIQSLVSQGASTSQYKNKYFEYEGMPEKRGAFSVEEAPSSSGQTQGNYVALSAAQDSESAIATNQGSFFTLGVYKSVMQAKNSGKLTLEQLKDQVSRSIETLAASNPERIHHPNLTGSTQLARSNLFVDKPGGGTGSSGSSSGSGNSAGSGSSAGADGSAWDKLLAVWQEREYDLGLSLNKSSYSLGDTSIITCKVPRKGYLNILNVDKRDNEVTVLYPNKYHPGNNVPANRTISIPDSGDSFQLRIRGPAGDNLIVALHTAQPVNLYEEARNKGIFALYASQQEKNNLYRAIRRKDQGSGSKAFGAAKAVVIVR